MLAFTLITKDTGYLTEEEYYLTPIQILTIFMKDRRYAYGLGVCSDFKLEIISFDAISAPELFK